MTVQLNAIFPKMNSLKPKVAHFDPTSKMFWESGVLAKINFGMLHTFGGTLCGNTKI